MPYTFAISADSGATAANLTPGSQQNRELSYWDGFPSTGGFVYNVPNGVADTCIWSFSSPLTSSPIAGVAWPTGDYSYSATFGGAGAGNITFRIQLLHVSSVGAIIDTILDNAGLTGSGIKAATAAAYTPTAANAGDRVQLRVLVTNASGSAQQFTIQGHGWVAGAWAPGLENFVTTPVLGWGAGPTYTEVRHIGPQLIDGDEHAIWGWGPNLMAYKATNPTAINKAQWDQVAGINVLALATAFGSAGFSFADMAVARVGDTLHIAFMIYSGGVTPALLYYTSYDGAAFTTPVLIKDWSGSPFAVHHTTVDIHAYANGDLIIVAGMTYTAPSDVVYFKRTSGVWASEVQINSTANHVRLIGAALDPVSERLHVIYADITATSILHRSLSSAAALDTEQTIYADAALDDLGGTDPERFAASAPVVDATGLVSLTIRFSDQTAHLWQAASGANPTFTDTGAIGLHYPHTHLLLDADGELFVVLNSNASWYIQRGPDWTAEAYRGFFGGVSPIKRLWREPRLDLATGKIAFIYQAAAGNAEDGGFLYDEFDPLLVSRVRLWDFDADTGDAALLDTETFGELGALEDYQRLFAKVEFLPLGEDVVVTPPLAAPTAGEITNALAGVSGPVAATFRYEERDHESRFISDITLAVYEATIELDNDRPVVRTAKLLIDANAIPAGFDPKNSHVTIIEDLQVETFQYDAWHTVTVSFPLGLFHLEAPRLIVQSNGRRFWDAEAADVTTHFVTSKTTTPYVVAAGTNYITAVEGVCELLGMQYLFSPNTAVTPVAFTWAPGTSYLQIANDLLMGINFYPLWANVDGVITSRLRVLPAVENAAVEYSTEAEPRMLVSPFERADDTSRFANRVAVVIDDPRRTPEYALRVNNDPDSAISIASLEGAVNSAAAISGGRVVNIATAGAIAEFELAKYAADAEKGRLLTFPDPRRDAHEFYRLTVEDNTVEAIWMVRGWRLALHPVREMQHEIGLAIDLNEAIVVTLSGTILTATEAQIVSGGRTLILTLPTGYTWRAAGAEFNAQREGIIDGLLSSGAEANGWNTTVQPVVLPANVVRTSDTVVTITLPAAAGYAITLPETVTVTIPVTAIAEFAESYVEPGATIIPT